MYKVMHKGTFISMVDEIRYVRKNDNNVWVQCDEEDAECISIHGDLYSLLETNVINYTAADYMNEQANAVERQSADIAYVAMMADIELPEV